jgi:xanthine dehydrogenase iron-sulfur cluster and FAD-binding subunit A
MKSPPFAYIRPRTLDEALAALTECPEGKVLAGGQSLVPLLNLRLAQPEYLIDLGGLSELAYIREESDGLAVGALTTQRMLEESDVVRGRVPLLSQAVEYVGHWQIRNRGTVGGSLAHADPSAEINVSWLTLGGRLSAQSSRAGERLLAAESFFRTYFTTTLAADEIITEIFFPSIGQHGWSFQEVARRPGDFALVAVAASVILERDTVLEARIGIAGVGDKPVRASNAEQLLEGQKVTEDRVRDAAYAASSELSARDDLHASGSYRREVAAVITGRALVEACARASHAGASKKGAERTTQRPRPAREVTMRPSHLEADKTSTTAFRDAENSPPTSRPPPAETRRRIHATVNGSAVDMDVEVRTSLADVLREELALTGTKLGCEHGVCGACTVLLDGHAVRSCLLLAVQADQTEILTIEGVAGEDSLHPIQEALWEEHGVQCGFCTPGFIMSILAFLRDHPSPSESELRIALDGNLCRCTGYQGILRAVRVVARTVHTSH